MNETLLGVLLGGLIGWIAPLLTLRYGERRWKFEAKLSHRKAERNRFESLYERTIVSIEENADEGNLSIRMLADIIVLMPEEVRKAFDDYIESGDRQQAKDKMKYLELVAAMKRDLKARDKAIDALFVE